MIFKLQRPLAGNNMNECLAYNEDRSVEIFVPVSDDVNMLFISRGYPTKLYIHAHLRDSKLVLDGIAPNQEW